MMTRKVLMRRVNQIAQVRAREAYEQEKHRLLAEVRKVASAHGHVERYLDEAQQTAVADQLRRTGSGFVTIPRGARASGG